MRLVRPLTVTGFLGTTTLLCGCPNPNAYTVPRTLDPGGVQFTVAPRYTDSASRAPRLPRATAPPRRRPSRAPCRRSRRSACASGSLTGSSSARACPTSTPSRRRQDPDAAWELDLAIDPGVQFIYLTTSSTDSRGNSVSASSGITYLHLPLLVGWNLSDSATLVASPGVVYTIATATLNVSNDAQQAGTASGFMGRLGFGVDIRTGKHFALHPRSRS